MNDHQTHTGIDRIIRWMQDHAQTVFVLRTVGAYGGVGLRILAKAAAHGLVAGFGTFILLHVLVFSMSEFFFPEQRDPNFTFDSMMWMVWAMALMAIFIILVKSMLVFARPTYRYSAHTPLGETEHDWGSPALRAVDLVQQAIVARAFGRNVDQLVLPISSVGRIDFRFNRITMTLPHRQAQLVERCALAIAGNALGQSHSTLDWGIAHDALSETPQNFTRDEIIREASVISHNTIHAFTLESREAVERELIQLGFVSSERMDELLVKVPAAVGPQAEQMTTAAQASAES